MDSRSAHNKFHLQPAPDLALTIDSDFDSGNLEYASLLSTGPPSHPLGDPLVKLQLAPAAEPFNPQFSARQSVKCFFHFSIISSEDVIIHAVVRRMAILGLIESSFDEYYRLCVGTKVPGSPEPVYVKERPEFMSFGKRGEDYELEFKYRVPAGERVYFAYHFPYSCERMAQYLQNLSQRFEQRRKQEHRGSMGVKGIGMGENSRIYLRNQLLIESVEKRPINLLTITQMTDEMNKFSTASLPKEPRISRSLFPYYDFEERPYKFSKPYVLLTCRVHPGETSSSFALQGFIDRITSQTPEAEFLRRTFVFLIVPMVNPDGVFHGTYRMDLLGHNLNRFYNNCAPHRHPSIFAINALLQHHSQQLVAFFDFHSHPQAKGSFLYGNAYSSIEDQIQSQVFARLLSLNSECFTYENCTFSEKNMNSKDINDILTKDGSARVCAYRKMLAAGLSNGVHCYGIELGYHGSPLKKQPNRPQELLQFKTPYRRQRKQFDTTDYRQNGAAIALTLAQVYIQTVQNIQQDAKQSLPEQRPDLLSSLRDQVSKQVYDRDDRFKNLDGGLLKKIKNIHSIIQGNLYGRILRKFPEIQLNVVQYLNRKLNRSMRRLPRASATQVRQAIKVVHSVQLRSGRPFDTVQIKKTLPDEQLDQQKPQNKNRSSKQSKTVIKTTKQKVNLTPIPLEFQLPQAKGKSRRPLKNQPISDRIIDIQIQSLPKIDSRRLRLISDIHKNRRKSPLNRQYIDQLKGTPAARGWLLRRMSQKKMTIQNGIDDIVDLEKYINIDNEDDSDQYNRIFEQVAASYDNSTNPELISQMNRVRNQAMFQKQPYQNKIAKKSQVNHHTARLSNQVPSYQDRPRPGSKQKDTKNRVTQIRLKPVPQRRSESVNSKFQLQLQMKEKYERQYQFDGNWKLKASEKS